MKPKFHVILLLIFAVLAISVKAQVKIGSNPTQINPNSILQLDGTSMGFTLPRVALTSLSSSSPLNTGVVLKGTVVYDTVSFAGYSPGMYYWDGAKWNFLSNNSTLSTYWSTAGNAGTSSGVNFLGTTDNTSLTVSTNATQRMQIDSIGDVNIGQGTFDPNNRERLLVNYGNTTSDNVATMTGSTNGYLQLGIQNTNSGNNASSDFVATADNGTDSTNYIDMGINSSTFAPSADNFGSADDGYLYVNALNLVIGTQSTGSDIIFLAAGGSIKQNQKMRISGSTGNIIVGKDENTSGVAPTGNTIRATNAGATSPANSSGGTLTVSGGNATGTGTGGAVNINGGSSASGTGGAVNINAGSNNATNINTGTSTQNVSIGNTSNNILLPGLPIPGAIIYTTAATGQIAQTAAGTIGQVLMSNGSGTPIWGNASSTAWALAGNSVVSGNFLGTINALPLVLKANNTQMGYFDGSLSSLALGAGAVNSSSDHNTAIGYSANTNSQYALALGSYASATGAQSVAIGNVPPSTTATTASGAQSISIGFSAGASGSQSTAIGFQATASGTEGIALGYDAQATATQSTATGMFSLSNQQYANSLGYQANATGLQSTAIGSATTASGQNSSAIGYNTKATATNSTALGYNAQTSQANTVLLGDATNTGLRVGIGTAAPSQSLEVGYTAGTIRVDGLKTGNTYNSSSTAATSTLLYANNSTGDIYALPTVNNATLVTNASGVPSWSTASAAAAWNLTGNAGTTPGTNFLGTTDAQSLYFKVNGTQAGYLQYNATAANANTTFGLSASAANSSTAIGAASNAAGTNSLAVGNSASATTNYSTVIGTSATSTATNAVALGYAATANNNNSVAVGNQAVGGYQAVSVGSNSTTSANQTVAIGYSTNTSGFQATAVGSGSTATNNNAVAMGYTANAAYQATAIGSNTVATANQSTALGYNASATGANSTAIGFGAATSQANALILGNNSVSVGIQTNTPQRALEVGGTGNTVRVDGLASGGTYNSSSTAANSTFVYSNNSTGDLYALPTVNSAILVTNASGVPSWSTTALSSASVNANNGLTYTAGSPNLIQLGGALIIPTTITDDNTNTLSLTSSATSSNGFTNTSNNVTSGNAESITANAITTGSGLKVSSSSALGSGGSVINISSTGNNASGSNAASVAANTTTAGNVLNVSGTALTTGSLINATAGTTTGNAENLAYNGVTTGNGINLSANGLTTGNAINISSTSAAGSAGTDDALINLTRSGANAGATHIAYGVNASVTTTGTISTNVGGYFSASGATNNYGLIVPSAGGFAGFGTSTPAQEVEVGGTANTIRVDGLKTGSTYNSASTTSNSTLLYSNNTTGDVYALPTVNNATLVTNGTGVPSWSTASATAGWSLIGNSGTTSAAIPGTYGTSTFGATDNWLGTISAKDLTIGTSNIERMRVLSTGYVGIGTSAPNRPLVVQGNSTNNVITIENTNSGGYSSMDMYDNTGNLASTFGYGNSAAGAPYTSRGYFNTYAHDFVWMNNVVGATTPVMTVSGQAATPGWVGIQTISPAQVLEVAPTTGTVRIDGLKTGNSYNSSATAATSTLLYANNSTGDIYALPTVNNATLVTNASGVPSWSTASATAGWNLTGNSGTTPGTNYVGTSDPQSLYFKINGGQAGFLEYNTTATNASVTFGPSATASAGSGSTAIGGSALAGSNTNAVAVGNSAQANGNNSTSLGYLTRSSQQAVAIGSNATASNNNAVAIGYSSAGAYQATAVGSNSSSGNNNAVAIGYSANASGFQGTAVGSNSIANNNQSAAFGFTSTAAYQATAIGSNSVASNNQATALGYTASATGTNSTAIGYGATTSQTNALVLGNNSVSVGILTSTPGANLDVNGTFRLGTSATSSVLNNIIKTTITPTSATIATNTTTAITVSGVTSATTNASVILNPRSALPNGVNIAYARVSAAGTIVIGFTTTSLTGVALGSITFDATIIQ